MMNDHQLSILDARMLAADCVADTTQSKYVSAFKRWRIYCSQHDLKCWLATPDDVIGYLYTVSQSRRGCTQATVYQHLSAIAYFYRLKKLPSPTTDPLVTMFMKGLKRREIESQKKPKQARPMTRDIIRQLNHFVYQKPRSLRVWRNVWRINAAFYGLLRWDDIRRLQVAHFQLKDTPTGLQYIFEIQGGKTLMYEKDLSRCLYATEDPELCPVRLTKKYFDFLGPDWTGSVVPSCSPRNPNVPHPSKVMSYTNAKEDLQYVLQLVGVSSIGFSEHSMRRGGATEAARMGASVTEIQSAGNWASLRTASRYVDCPKMRNQQLQRFLG